MELTTYFAYFKLLSKIQSNDLGMEKSCPSMTISHQMMPHLTKSIFSLVSFMNLHLKTCVFLLLVSLESLMNVYFVSLAQGTFDCSSNVTTTVQILHFLYIHMRRCFISEGVYMRICCNYLHEMPRNKIHCRCCFIAVILTEMKVLTLYHPKRTFISVKMTAMKQHPQ